MFSTVFSLHRISKAVRLRKILLFSAIAFVLTGAAAFASAQQDQSGQTGASSQQQNPNQQEAPPEAGGPNGEVGPYGIPKKGEEAPPPPPPSRPKKIEGMPDYSIHVDVPLVTVPVMVTTKDGQFIPNLKKENFRISEDGQAQKINDFKVEEAPITAALLIEFATNYMAYQALEASYVFGSTLKKDDWVAVISYA